MKHKVAKAFRNNKKLWRKLEDIYFDRGPCEYPQDFLLKLEIQNWIINTFPQCKGKSQLANKMLKVFYDESGVIELEKL